MRQKRQALYKQRGHSHYAVDIATAGFYTQRTSNLKIASCERGSIILSVLCVFLTLFLVQSWAYGQPKQNAIITGQNIAVEYPVAVKILASKQAFMKMMKLHQGANDLRDLLVAEGFNKNYVENAYGWKVHDSEVAKKVAEMEMDFYRVYPGVELGGASALLKKYDFTKSREYGNNLYSVRETKDIIKHAHECGYIPDMVFKRLSKLLKKFYSSRLKQDEDKARQLYQSLIELLEDRYL